MQSWKIDKNFSLDSSKNVITIGSFDGVHVGHQAVIGNTVRLAKKQEGASVVVTFSPHPLKVVDPKNAPKLLNTDEEKEKYISLLDVDYLLFLEFDKGLARLSPDEFIKDIIVDKLNPAIIVVGYDHGFGKSRSGNVESLSQLGDEFGFAVRVVEPKLASGQIVSSTNLRVAIENDNWQIVRKMLGRYYRFSGEVVYGAQRGNLLQFPTANIRVEDEDKLIPNDGVYAVWVLFKDRVLKGAMNIGTNPTFGENERSIEVFVFDFSEDIYEETLEVQVVEKVRSEVRFPDAKSLVEQVRQDIQIIKDILQKNKL